MVIYFIPRTNTPFLQPLRKQYLKRTARTINTSHLEQRKKTMPVKTVLLKLTTMGATESL